jgi:S-adenosylmethionine:tRNA ribosyltransferase-isomerase
MPGYGRPEEKTNRVSVRTSDFDYVLPPERIAQRPLERREDSRLMRLIRGSGAREHRRFAELPSLLRRGDLLVVNDTRVLPARFLARRASGGRIEGLFCREIEPGLWEALLKGAGRCRTGEKLSLEGAGEVSLELRERQGGGRCLLAVEPAEPATNVLERCGATPLPPYIRRPRLMSDRDDRRRYQTVYASRPGAVAAPTAGLHFTPELLAALDAAGVERVAVTLHVGPGTFAPVKSDEPACHRMHAEWYELAAPVADRLSAGKAEGRRIIAVGTTSLRVLETVIREKGGLAAASGWTELFVYPPAEFGAVDALLTNFHLPRSTLLMLVAAFCAPGRTDGIRVILDAYAEAIRQGYRFYSYGDAMLIE